MDNKRTKIILFFLSLFILVLMFTGNPPIENTHIDEPSPIIGKQNNRPLISENSIENTREITNDSANNSNRKSQPSQFKKNCLDNIKAMKKDMGDEIISKAIQTHIMEIFNNCVYEIDMELALTEKEFSSTTENNICLNRVYSIRDSLLDLGTEAQNFGSLPNNTELERSEIAASFSRIRSNIIDKGESAMNNRSVNCLRN